MMQEPGRRIVTKGEYVKAQSKRVALLMLGIGLLFATCYSIYAIRCLWMLAADRLTSPGWLSAIAWGVLMFSSIFVGGVLLAMIAIAGSDTLRKAKILDPGIPLTRANIGDLPAPASLVRASQEPLQALEAMLLRAIVQEPETPPEQLVRPAGGRSTHE